jgi:hypothetical protein
MKSIFSSCLFLGETFELKNNFLGLGVAQVVKHLPCKCKTLSLNPSTAKRKKK